MFCFKKSENMYTLLGSKNTLSKYMDTDLL